MSTTKDNSIVVLASAVTTAVAVTAFTTYTLTKRSEEQKQKAIVRRQYLRDKLLKEKTAVARSQSGEPPSGVLLNDVKLDKVYLWECEDLRKRFPMANVVNTMVCRANPIPAMRSPLLRQKSSSVESTENLAELGESHHVTQYNKLITDHECILGEIVRKPNGPTHTISYMRAGPRKLLHFDPAKVNAAIVTCGGLCPGLNDVIAYITKTLINIYGIDGTVYGIQGKFRFLLECG
jgi:6-phosphofructokinase 1